MASDGMLGLVLLGVESRNGSEVMSRHFVARRAEPRIVDPATHPQELVNFTVAAEFLKMDRRDVTAYVDEGKIAYEWKGRRRRIHVTELVRFKAWLAERAQAS